MKPLVFPPTKTKFIPGVNDLETMRPDLLKFWARSNVVKPNAIYYRSNSTADWVCPNSHSYKAPVWVVENGAQCGQCWKEQQGIAAGFGNKSFLSLGAKHPHLAAELVDPSLADELSQSSHQQVEWYCRRYAHHQHTYRLSPNQRLQGRNCTYCSLRNLLPGFNDIISVRPDLETELVDVVAAKLTLANSKESVDWKHEAEEGVTHYWTQRVSDRVYGTSSCTVCLGFTVQPGVNDFGLFLHGTGLVLASTNVFSPSEVALGSNKILTLECREHDPPHLITGKAKDFTSGKRVCQDCRPKSDHFSSKGEREVADFVRSLAYPKDLKVEANVRRFKGKGVAELDLLVPELKFALDFNGTYWHQEGVFKPLGFHATKRRLVANLGFSYLEVWEDAWRDDRARVELAIRQLLKLS